MFYSHFSAHGKLNGPSEIIDEIPFRYAHAEIRVICAKADCYGVILSVPLKLCINISKPDLMSAIQTVCVCAF